MMDNKQLQQLEEENLKLRSQLQELRARQKSSPSFLKWLGKVTSRAIIGKNLKESMQQLYAELPRDVRRETLADVTSSLIQRLTRIGTFALVVGLVPLLILLTQTWILDNQNEKLDHQNDLINGQNQLLDQQINLEEGSRRSSVIFLMSNIMDKIDEELKNNRGGSRRLSDELIGRIVSLSHAFRPYRYLENNKLIPKPLSPERGQLLYTLINSELELETYDRIFDKANFSYSDLQEANFSGAYLQGVNLAHSNVEGGKFENAILTLANFQEANLKRCLFDNTEMNSANFRLADLEHSEWYDVLAQKINLSFANIKEAFFNGDFSEAELEGVLLHNATLNYVVLRNAFFFNSSWVDRLKGYQLKGSFSISENYTVEMDLISNTKKNEVDTIFRLIPRLDSPKLQASFCESMALNIIRSAAGIQRLDRQQRQAGDPVKYFAQSSPYTEGLTGESDPVFSFIVSTQDTSKFDARVLVKFNPANGKVWTISPTFGDTIIQKYNENLLAEFLETCK